MYIQLLTLLLDVVEGVDTDLGRGGGHPGGEVAREVDEDEVEGDGRGQEEYPRSSEKMSFTRLLNKGLHWVSVISRSCSIPYTQLAVLKNKQKVTLIQCTPTGGKLGHL